MVNCKDKENLTECILRKLIVLAAVLALLIPVISPKVFAASSVTISTESSVKGGDTFTVAVTFGGGSVGRVDASLSYDTDKLTYISGGSSSGNTGYVQLAQAGTDGSVTFNIKFQAVADGDTTLSVTTYEMYDLDESYMSEQPSAAKTISIAGNAASDQLITETTSPDKPVKETELSGVDEKQTGSTSGNGILLMIALIAIPVILIIVIAVILAKKKKKAAPAKHSSGSEPGDRGNSAASEKGAIHGSCGAGDMHAGSTQSGRGYEDGLHYGGAMYDGHNGGYDMHADGVQDGYGMREDPYYRSPAGTAGPQGADIRDEKEIRGERDFRKRIGAIRDEYREDRKRASEETEVWSDWEGYDDNDF